VPHAAGAGIGKSTGGKTGGKSAGGMPYADAASGLTWAKAKAAELLKHLQKQYPDSVYAQKLLVNLVDIVAKPPAAAGLGVANQVDGVISLEVRDPADGVRPPARLLRTLVHEMAHIVTTFESEPRGPHGPAWAGAFKWLLNVAVNDLRWKVELACYECDTSSHICDKSVCPGCTWDCPGPFPLTPGVRHPKPYVFDIDNWPVAAYRRLCVFKPVEYQWHKDVCASRTRNF
jgi:hypothetical protein